MISCVSCPPLGDAVDDDVIDGVVDDAIGDAIETDFCALSDVNGRGNDDVDDGEFTDGVP